MPGAGRALLAAGFALAVCFAAPRAGAVETNVVIQGFEYHPDAVEIAPGDTVAWTNLDATVHTVTADDHSFDSGRLDQGQRYALAFNQPGTYPYHCTLHDHQGSVEVRGVAPTTTTTGPPPTTSAPPVTAATGPSNPAPAAFHQPTPTSVAPAAHPPPESVPPDPGTGAAPASQVQGSSGAAPNHDLGAVSVVAAPPVTAPPPFAPLAVLAGVLVLTGVVTSQLWLWSPDAAVRRLRALAAVLTLLSGAIHLSLRLEVSYPEPTRSLFLAQAVAGLIVAAVLVGSSSRRGVRLGVAFHAVSLAAFALSRTVGMFGFHEAGWDPSPEAALAVAAEVAGVGLLGLVMSVLRAPPPLHHEG